MDVPGCSVKALCNAVALRDVDGTLLDLERGLCPGSREFFEHVRHDFWIRTALEVRRRVSSKMAWTYSRGLSRAAKNLNSSLVNPVRAPLSHNPTDARQVEIRGKSSVLVASTTIFDVSYRMGRETRVFASSDATGCRCLSRLSEAP
jgi:hypothetical protein